MSTPQRAQPEDADGILALEALFPGDRLSARALRHLLRVPTARVLVVRAADTTSVVTAALVLLLRRGSRVARIYSLAVAPAARGRGLAQSLVRAAEADARAAGCDRVRLEVRADNHAAQGLYAGLGYEQWQVLPGYYDDGGDGLRLQKALIEGG